MFLLVKKKSCVNMKIAIKSKKSFRDNGSSQVNELISCAVQFDGTDHVEFVFNTVDFDKRANFNPDDFDTFLICCRN